MVQKEPTPNNRDSRLKEVATLGGGCFWCIEAVFIEIKGVEKVETGYAGGNIANPTYQQVSTGKTSHAEVAQITFDPKLISFKEILEFFFTAHDPTTWNRQGADVGSWYRSVIFYHTLEQKRIAEEVFKEINATKIWGKPIVAQTEPFKEFYKAEEYHQGYFERNPEKAYCQLVIRPKIVKLRIKYRNKLKKTVRG